MNYWLLCLERNDIQHCMKIGTFGLSRKLLIGAVRENDKVVCCAGKGDWKIIATGLATTDYFVDDGRIFLKEGIFPDRFNFSCEKLNHEIDIIPLIEEFSFITNPGYWAVFFRNGIVKMSQKDWNLIAEKESKLSKA